MPPIVKVAVRELVNLFIVKSASALMVPALLASPLKVACLAMVILPDFKLINLAVLVSSNSALALMTPELVASPRSCHRPPLVKVAPWKLINRLVSKPLLALIVPWFDSSPLKIASNIDPDIVFGVSTVKIPVVKLINLAVLVSSKPDSALIVPMLVTSPRKEDSPPPAIILKPAGLVKVPSATKPLVSIICLFALLLT